GGNGTVEAVQNQAFIDWLRDSAPRFNKVLSICSATFILAQAGLLTGKTVTTHWSVCGLLQTLYPDVTVNENAIYLQNGAIYTSAGVSTGIDLSLAVVTEDLGRELAMQVAQDLVLYLHRPGGQRQFSPVMALQKQQRTSFSELVIWMSEHLHQPLDIDTLAEKACMSPRHFSRKFQQETGVSPMRFLNQLRLEKSRTLLEQKHQAVQSVAQACGFQSAETFRRQFHEHYGISPMQYQGRF
ncbi:MAG TPA: helix-turn-helix domain-containing protein, partial [Pseudomonadales bacterium]|nr:helix-turn-helix domain-containing protein [Pseudomonadales bacterium]